MMHRVQLSIVALALSALLAASCVLAGQDEPYDSRCPFARESFAAGPNDTSLTPPVWPFAFNVTMAKINTEDKSQIQWCNMYYDWNQMAQRFDFVDSYYTTDCEFGNVELTILFVDGVFLHINPRKNTCCTAGRLPPVSPWWLRSTRLVGHRVFRKMWAQAWEFDDEEPLQYWAKNDELRSPLRSYNQAQDPGATDYFDFVVGPQDPELFKRPAGECPPCRRQAISIEPQLNNVHKQLLSGQWNLFTSDVSTA